MLEQFTVFAKLGTLSAAAEELHITQPTLSRSMKKLEQELGVSLFDRSSSRIALNETGRFAVQYAKKVLEANQELAERTAAYDRSRRTICFGSCASFPINMLMPILQDTFGAMAITAEIATSSSLPAFSSDRSMERSGIPDGRTAIPISDSSAHAVYYLACMNDEKRKMQRRFRRCMLLKCAFSLSFFRFYYEHHGAAQLVLHFGKAHHVLRRLCRLNRGKAALIDATPPLRQVRRGCAAYRHKR